MGLGFLTAIAAMFAINKDQKASEKNVYNESVQALQKTNTRLEAKLMLKYGETDGKRLLVARGFVPTSLKYDGKPDPEKARTAEFKFSGGDCRGVKERIRALEHLKLPLTDENIYGDWPTNYSDMQKRLKYDFLRYSTQPVGTYINRKNYGVCEIMDIRYEYPKVYYTLKVVSTKMFLYRQPVVESEYYPY